jgi:hypothetical protein
MGLGAAIGVLVTERTWLEKDITSSARGSRGS